MKCHPRRKAYFIVHFNAETNEYIGCDIWSSPPWMQSVLPKDRIFGIFLEADGDTYQDADTALFNDLAHRVAWGQKSWVKLTSCWLHRNQDTFQNKIEEIKQWEQSQLQKSDVDSIPAVLTSGSSSAK